jgi:teichuronic acid exporter
MLRSRARSAVLWSGVDMFARRGAGFLVTVVLARLLIPEDFGTIALLSIFLGVASLFVNAGLGLGLIQRQDVTHVDESTVFWFNLCVALLMALLLAAGAPLIANFFAVPLLVPLTFVMAANLVVSALGSIQSALMAKRLDFKTPMKVGVSSTFVSGTVGVYMAWRGYGVWALAGQTLTGSLVSTGLTWALVRWRPLLVFSFDSFRRLFAFSGWLFVSWLLDTVFQRAYTLVLGKIYGTYELGIYNRADTTQQLASGVPTDVLSKVAFPLFSSVSEDKERLRRGMRMATRAATLIIAPVMMGLAVLAKPFIAVVFGEQWLPAVPILQVLCIVGLFYPLHVINLSVLQAQGHSRLFFRLEVVKKSLGIVFLLGGSLFGVLGIAWSRVLASAVGLVINTYYTRKFLGYGSGALLKDCLPSLLPAGAMAVLIHLAQGHMGSSVVVALSLSVLLGAGAYVSLNLLVGATPFKESLRLMMGRGQES